MNKKSELDCYLFFMWNVWNYDICIKLFGVCLGEHIYRKWMNYCEEIGCVGAAASFYSALDSDKRRRIVECAVAHYNR